jgi:hypothetical protein
MFAATTMLLGAPALAQTLTPNQTLPAPCSPPCQPGEMCVQGQCMVPAPPQDAPPAPPPVAPAPVAPEPTPVPPAAAPPPPDAETFEDEAPPPPRRKKARPARKETADDDEVSWRRGVLVMPFAGAHTIQGIVADDYDAGPRFGALFGAHAAPFLSLNLELAMDLLSPKVQPGTPTRGLDVSGQDFTIAFSPLFHASSGIGEFVVGPKLGFWGSGIDVTQAGAETIQLSQTGWAFGFNMGAFAGMADQAAIGALVSYQMTHLSQSCLRSSISGMCTSADGAPQILSFNIAALF